MNKELAALKEERTKLLDRINELNLEIQSKTIEGYDFQGKYVHSETYGYMYVTYQSFEQCKNIYESQVFFQGLGFVGLLGTYRDNSFVTYDAMEEWKISYRLLMDDIKSGKFKEVTKEEFVSEMKKLCSDLFNQFQFQLSKIDEIKTEDIN